MKILLCTGDVKLNNRILGELDSDVEVVEIDYLEDVVSKTWDETPEVVIISDHAPTKEVLEKEGKKDILIYKLIKELNNTCEVTLVSNKSFSHPLIVRLIEMDFFKISPYEIVERMTELPKNREELASLLPNGEEPHLLLTNHRRDDVFVPPPSPENEAYLPTPVLKTRNIDKNAITSVFWSPIPNVGLGSFVRNVGAVLANQGKKVLIVELDWEYPKLARQTALTHPTRVLKRALQSLVNNERNLENFIVNNTIAEEELPHTHNQAKVRLRDLPDSLYVLCRNAKIEHEENPLIEDERIIEKLFFEAKQLGFNHILVDVPSNPEHFFTMLSLLVADERFMVVDDSFATSGIAKNAMEAFKELEINQDNFELIINRLPEGLSSSDISEFYNMTPVATVPLCRELTINQMDLKLSGGEDYMNAIYGFIRRYGIEVKSKLSDGPKEKRKFSLFGF